MNVISRCNDLLLVSKICHEFKTNWEFFEWKGWLLFTGLELPWDIKRVVAGCR